jgi:hypothetical protein
VAATIPTANDMSRNINRDIENHETSSAQLFSAEKERLSHYLTAVS